MIYADNAATTKISEVAFERMLPFLRDQYGNPSSQYSFGLKAKRAVEHARAQAAAAIGAEEGDIIFTSGGSEANNWVLRGVVESFPREKIHIITTTIEHDSVLNTCRALDTRGVEVTYLPVNSDGALEPRSVWEAIKPNTKLVSIMLANNEIGTIEPIAEVGKLLYGKGILFHTDAVQAIGHIPINIKDLRIDFLSASAHKFNGAKGVGFLYMRSPLPQLIFGGGQEGGKRAGTENVAGIVAAGYALEENVKNMGETAERLKIMVQTTVKALQSKLPNIRINSVARNCLPGIISISFKGASGEALMNLLDLKGITISTGSACHSGRAEPTHVLSALGLSEEEAKSSVRISYGRYNTEEEAAVVADALCEAYSKITRQPLLQT